MAILATEGGQSELEKPKEALENAGAATDVIAPAHDIKGSRIKGWSKTPGVMRKVDVKLEDAECVRHAGASQGG